MESGLLMIFSYIFEINGKILTVIFMVSRFIFENGSYIDQFKRQREFRGIY